MAKVLSLLDTCLMHFAEFPHEVLPFVDDVKSNSITETSSLDIEENASEILNIGFPPALMQRVLEFSKCNRSITLEKLRLFRICSNFADESFTELNLNWCTDLDTKSPSFDKLLRFEVPNLTSVDFSGLNISDANLYAIASGCKKLREIHLHKNRMVTNDGIMKICSSAEKTLTSLELSGMSAMTDKGIINVLKTVGKNLISLDLSFNTHLTDFVASAIGCCCSNLSELYLTSCHDMVTQESIEAIIENNSGLSRIDMSCCTQLYGGESFWSLFSDLDDLKNLNLSYIPILSSEGFHHFDSALFRLEHLNIAECVGIRGTDFFTCINSYSAANQNINLKLVSLNMSNTRTPANFLQMILAKCPSLTALDLTESRHVCDYIFENLLQTRASRLVKLNLSLCQRIADLERLLLSETCSSLELLNLKSCVHTTGKALVAIQNCWRLSSLNLSRIGSLTDERFSGILSHCCMLTEIDVEGCTGITDESSIGFKNCPGIRKLILDDTNIGDKTLISIGEHLKRLEWLLVCGTRISDVGIREFCKMTTSHTPALFSTAPTVLELADNSSKLTNMSLTALADHPRIKTSLRNLNLRENSLIGDESLLRLSEFSALTSLDIHGCNISFKTVEHLLQSCVKLRTFQFSIENFDPIQLKECIEKVRREHHMCKSSTGMSILVNGFPY